ncbi:penicillin-binding protein activator LpoB [Acerihabitans arboris]|uniref:Penicillin-binding protein activator LpoB n=1 Tax=Acerihabitans arboris TaxID=2691583 RepID=A0A845SEW6_9GAMM|nr:penicillin-binding protein activator LpoB [Acerihabitans arboris]NDL61907.1 penicillin-binding protein activator LpoB [Acerihabitans arboris]
MKKYLFVVLAALVLTGCPTRAPEPEQPPATIEPAQPVPTPQPVPQPQPVPTPPKIRTLDWQASVDPLVKQMLGAQGIAPGSVLLINSMKNNTNGSVQTGKATAALYSALASNSTFTVISQEQMASAKQTLGLSVDDSLESRSKAVGLARYVNAQYVLYSDANGDAKQPEIEMQLMLVQSGEIVWSGKGLAQE